MDSFDHGRSHFTISCCLDASSVHLRHAKFLKDMISRIFRPFGYSHSCYPLMRQILRFLVAFRQRVQCVVPLHQILTLQHKQFTRSDVTKSADIDFILFWAVFTPVYEDLCFIYQHYWNHVISSYHFPQHFTIFFWLYPLNLHLNS